MSWSIHQVENVTATEAYAKLHGQTLPTAIRLYVYAAIGALQAKYGLDVRVTVTGHGHLSDGTDNETSDCTLEIKRAEVVRKPTTFLDEPYAGESPKRETMSAHAIAAGVSRYQDD